MLTAERTIEASWLPAMPSDASANTTVLPVTTAVRSGGSRRATIAASRRWRSAPDRRRAARRGADQEIDRLWLVLAKRRSFAFGIMKRRSEISLRVAGTRSAEAAPPSTARFRPPGNRRSRAWRSRRGRVDEALQALQGLDVHGLAKGAFAGPLTMM
jgi:hypothetical protein